MAISNNTDWEVDPVGGNDLNGAGFDSNLIVSVPDMTGLLSPTGGGTLGAGTYYVRVCYSNASSGTTWGRLSNEVSITLNGSGTQNKIQVTSPAAVNDAAWYTVFASTVSGGTPSVQASNVSIGTNINIGAASEGSCAGCGKIYNYGPDKSAVSFTSLSAAGGTSTLQSAATPFTQNHVGNIIHLNYGVGVSLNGSSQYLTLASNASYNTEAAGNMTWVVWTKMSSASPSGPMTVISKTTGASGASIEYILYYDTATSKFTWKVGDGGSTNVTPVAASVTTADTNWHMVTVTWDVGNKICGISIDGGNFNTASYVWTNATGSNTINIGRRNATTPDQLWNGSLDTMALWTGRVLSNTEVASLYNSGTPYNVFNLPDTYYDFLTSWWDFDDSLTNANTRADLVAAQAMAAVGTPPGVAGVNGTGIAGGHYRIASNNQGVVTLDRQCAVSVSSTGATGILGGAKKTISAVLPVNMISFSQFTAMSNGKIWLTGTTTMTRVAFNVPGGQFYSRTGYAAAVAISIEGYGTTHGDMVKPTISAGSITTPSGGTILMQTGGQSGLSVVVRNIIFDGNNVARCLIVGGSVNNMMFFNCIFQNLTGGSSGGIVTNTCTCINCEYVNCGSSPNSLVGNSSLRNCYISGGSYASFSTNSYFTTINITNTVIDSPPFKVGGYIVGPGSIFEDVLIYTNLDSTLNFPNSSDILLKNVHIEGGGATPYNLGNAPRIILQNCSAYVTSGSPTYLTGETDNNGFITCSASALNDPTGATEGHKDFGLNTAAGGGALLRAKGFGRIGAIGGTLNSVNDSKDDVGPIQHPDTGTAAVTRGFVF